MGARNDPPQSRRGEPGAACDRVCALLESVVSIESELDPDVVLRRSVEAAARLVGAGYGALGVIGPGGRLSRFVTAGAGREWQETPVQEFPDARFLRVPVRVRGELFATFYLAEKAGDGEFDDDDEIAVTALATAAGVAIENARLYREAQRRERWLRALAEISTSLLSGADPGDVRALITGRARQICDASLAVMAVAHGRYLVIEAAEGAHAELLRGFRLPIDETVAGQVYRSGVALALDGSPLPGGIPAGPALIVPMGSGWHARGVLSVVNPPDGAAFGGPARRLLETFAGQAVVALELAERRRDAERLVVLEDRDRIARDLHDTVIQRLFATAMNLMGVVKLAEAPEVRARVQRAVDDLDDTIRRIRQAIIALQAARDERWRVPHR